MNEDYLCDSCKVLKKSIADEIDKKVGSTVGQQPNSFFRQYDMLYKANGGKYPSIQQLGIKL